MTKMVYFHPKMNNPPMGGGDVHSYEILKSLKELGFKLYLFILETLKRPVIQRDSWGFEEVVIFSAEKEKNILRDQFSSFIDRVNPSYIFMNYASWDFVLDHQRHRQIKRIIYNHHFESVRKKMANAFTDAWNQINPKNLEEVHPDLYALDFFKKKVFEPDSEEYQTYDRYDLTFVIEDYGATLIRNSCKKTKIISFPVTLTPRESESTYQKLALYTMSPYSFSFQGYYFFVKQVLPLLLKKSPLFRVRLTGLGSEYFFSVPNVICKSYISDLKKEYERASLSLSPSFAGTGQQIKILESMHYGVASVCMEVPSQFNPIRHGESGFIAKSAEEFAEYALRLFHSPELARQMGQKAKEEARKYYSNSLLKEKLLAIRTIGSCLE